MLVRPERLELPTLWFEVVRSTLPNLARGVANRTDSASWGKFPQNHFPLLLLSSTTGLPLFYRALRDIFVTDTSSAELRRQGSNESKRRLMACWDLDLPIRCGARRFSV
jgi:hypothetical protein